MLKEIVSGQIIIHSISNGLIVEEGETGKQTSFKTKKEFMEYLDSIMTYTLTDEEKNRQVILINCPSQTRSRIQAIKIIRQYTSSYGCSALGLKETKDIVDGAVSNVIPMKFDAETALKFVNDLETIGCQARIS